MDTINSFSGHNRFLSSFYPAIVIVDSISYCTVEHGYQASKNLSVEYRKTIRDATTPGEAKRLGQKVSLRADWDDIKIDRMYTLVKQKFSLPGLKESLIATGDAELIEGNWWGDTFWGICKGVGRNELGKILMKVRWELNHGIV